MKTPRMPTPGQSRPATNMLIVAAVALLAMLLVACGGDDGSNNGGGGGKLLGPTVSRAQPQGDARNVRLGFSTLPPERTTDAYIGAFATAAAYADIVLIQRAPPWEDFLAGGQISKATAGTTVTETKLLDQYDGLQLFYAIDPTDGVVQRSRIANLPASIDPEAGFNDPELRNAFKAYVTYVVKNYKPAYLALGVEINMLYERNRQQFDAFVSLYREAYEDVKTSDPKILVFPTFQLEDLEGKFGQVHPPHWEVLQRFQGTMDVLAISTYPYLAEFRSAAEIPENYYSQVREHWQGPVLISESGYASAPVEGEVNVGSEEDQAAFLQRLLKDADEDRFLAVVWFAALDPAFASQGTATVFKDIGLRRSDGANKLAWGLWEEWSRRPLN